jgi:hypothetical protein
MIMTCPTFFFHKIGPIKLQATLLQLCRKVPLFLSNYFPNACKDSTCFPHAYIPCFGYQEKTKNISNIYRLTAHEYQSLQKYILDERQERST